MIQAVLLFLLLIVVLGMGGKLLNWLRLPQKRSPPRSLEQASRCPVCKSFVVGRAPASCAREACPYRT
jgi:hypothetical protein